MATQDLLDELLSGNLNDPATVGVVTLLRHETKSEFRLLRTEMNQRFDKVDERFDKVDERFDKVDERFDKVDERFDRMDERFARLENSLDMVAQQIAQMLKK